MSALIIVARLVHISTAVFWGGAILFVNFLLGPSVTSVGPEGAKVMQELIRRKYFETIIVAATLTILSGLYLMDVDSDHFSAAWFATRFGQGLSTGMLAALIAYVIGVFGVRPALYRMLALGGEMMKAPAEQREGIQAQMAVARGRLMSMGMIGTVMLLIAIFAMAVSRYL